MKTIIVRANRAHWINKHLIYLLTLPIFLYVFVLSVNNIFAVDLTGGLLDDQRPVGSGYVVVFGAPIYLFYYVKLVWEICVNLPILVQIEGGRLIWGRGGPKSLILGEVKDLEIERDGSELRVEHPQTGGPYTLDFQNTDTDIEAFMSVWASVR